MSNLQLGSLVLHTELLVYLLAGIAGAIIVRLCSQGMERAEQIQSAAWNIVWVWVVLWKGSYVIFDFATFKDNWKSILFFDGGQKGFWLAAVVCLIYIGLSFYKYAGRQHVAKLIAACLSGWLFIYSAAHIVWGSEATWQQYAMLAWSILLIVLVSRSTWQFTGKTLPNLGAFLLITGLVSYLAFSQIELNWRQAAPASLADHNVGIKVGQIAPPFETVNLSGEAVQLSDFKGKTVLLNFWTTWCSVCKAEMPHVEKLYTDLPADQYAIISVNATSQDSGAAQAGKYAEDNQLSFPIVLDESGAISKAYRVRAFPVTYILDPSGVIRRHQTGAISYDEMKKALERASKQSAEPGAAN